ncbi:MAG: hypothetical protein HKN87_24275 [Saprospiraceae bacterium]|nr:hypothetical protein [Saprospiraceae bacterium]
MKERPDIWENRKNDFLESEHKEDSKFNITSKEVLPDFFTLLSPEIVHAPNRPRCTAYGSMTH